MRSDHIPTSWSVLSRAPSRTTYFRRTRTVDLFNPVFAWLRRFAAGDRWAWKAALWLVGLSLFFQFPAYNYFVDHLRGLDPAPFWDHFQEQRRALLTWTEQPRGSHLEKTAFRLTAPFIAKVFHLGTVGLYFFQFAMGVGLLLLTLRSCERRCGDRVQAILFTGGLVFTYAGSASFFDIWGQGDPFGYFFLVVAVCSRTPSIILAATMLASFADERGLIASGIVLLHHLLDAPADERGHVRLRPNRRAIAVAVGWMLYFLLRFALIHFRGFHTGTGELGLGMFFRNLDQLLWALWTGLEGQWLIVLAFLLLLWQGEGRSWALLFLGAIAVLGGVAVLVDDTTRSMAYGFVLLFPAFAWMHRHVRRKQVRMLLFFSFAISFIHPQYFKLGAGSMYPVDPLFMKLLHVVKLKLGL